MLCLKKLILLILSTGEKCAWPIVFIVEEHGLFTKAFLVWMQYHLRYMAY